MPRFLKFVSLLRAQSNFRSPKSHLCVNGSYHLLQFLRFCGTERAHDIRNGGTSEKNYDAVRIEAQHALLEYFHVTRNMHFLDAENMSKNSPKFLDGLLKEAGIGDGDDDDDVGHSLARFLCFRPINEFEPFFESIGLKPSEYASFLPPNLMFLSDDELFMHNYHVLCNFGIARTTIGRICKEATEVFRYDRGILQSKLQSFQNLGFRKSLIAKTIASSPYLLRGNGNLKLLEFLDKLRNAGIECDWLEKHILVGDSYNWKTMLELMCFLGELGLTGERLGEVIMKNPDILLEHSGYHTFRILVLLLKFGSSQSDLQTMSLQFPHMPVVNFVNNLFHSYKFFAEIKMSVEDIGQMFRSYSLLLGSCKLKGSQWIQATTTGYGIRKMCQMVKDDPLVLRKWAMRLRSGQPRRASKGVEYKALKFKCQKTMLLSSIGSDQELEKTKESRPDNEANLQESRKERMESRSVKNAKFLLSLGFVEESKEMEKVLQRFQGDAMALQERFDCLVAAGVGREDVIKMLKKTPSIFYFSKGAIERKINFLVKELGYPLSEVVTFPELIKFSPKRIKLRLLMYEWLYREGVLNHKLAMSTILPLPERKFVRKYVNLHRRGPQYWERIKEMIYSI